MGRREVRVGGSRVRLLNVNIRRLSGLKHKLVCHFKLAADMRLTIMLRGAARR